MEAAAIDRKTESSPVLPPPTVASKASRKAPPTNPRLYRPRGYDRTQVDILQYIFANVQDMSLKKNMKDIIIKTSFESNKNSFRRKDYLFV